MNNKWMIVFAPAFFEVCWVIGLKHAEGPLEWTGTILAIVISFYGLLAAGKYLPVGTVYAVFVGLGTAGTVAADILFFAEPFNTVKIALILVLLAGVIGLKLITDEQQEEKGGNA